jgi:hypothetical protein
MKQREFVIALNILKVQAGRLGLFETMHAIDTATKKVGWEIAEKLKKAKKLAKEKRKGRK